MWCCIFVSHFLGAKGINLKPFPCKHMQKINSQCDSRIFNKLPLATAISFCRQLKKTPQILKVTKLSAPKKTPKDNTFWKRILIPHSDSMGGLWWLDFLVTKPNMEPSHTTRGKPRASIILVLEKWCHGFFYFARRLMVFWCGKNGCAKKWWKWINFNPQQKWLVVSHVWLQNLKPLQG